MIRIISTEILRISLFFPVVLYCTPRSRRFPSALRTISKKNVLETVKTQTCSRYYEFCFV